MRVLTFMVLFGLAAPALAQNSKPQADNEIVVTGVANGARVVQVDFDKVWKGCAECKRALAKLDLLAQNYRDELDVARKMASGPSTAHCGDATPSALLSFQRSSAEPVTTRPMTSREKIDGLCAARLADTSRRTFQALGQKYVRPEQAKLLAYMRMFLDQLAPHVAEATEAERIAHRASVGLTDVKRTKLSAKKLTRIDVTDAVIRRLDAKDFTIELPDPPARGAARK